MAGVFRFDGGKIVLQFQWNAEGGLVIVTLKKMSLRQKVALLSIGNGLFILVIVIALFYVSLTDNIEKQISLQALNVAALSASRSEVIAAYASTDPSLTLKNVAHDIMHKTNAAFVVFLSPSGIRYSHPDESLIGKQFSGGDEDIALHEGKAYTSKAVGVSGPSIRAFAPIFDAAGRQIGVVAVGYWGPDINSVIRDVFQILYVILPVSFCLIGLFAYILSRHVKGILFGMEPIEIATKLEQREAMLESVREGIIAIGADCRISVANSAARRIFPPATLILGRHIEQVIENTRLPAVMQSGEAELDEPMTVNEHRVLANRIPLIVGHKAVGAISTFRDMTELNKLAEELTGANKIVDTLRSRTHEFMNKLQAISGLIQLGCYDEVERYIQKITRQEQSFIEFLLNKIKNLTIAGLLESKAATAQERKIRFDVDGQSTLVELPPGFDENASVVVLGNLLDNAMDAVEELPPERRRVSVLMQQTAEHLIIRVADSGPGVDAAQQEMVFAKGFTTKKFGRGYGLANVKMLVDAAGGTLELISAGNGAAFHILIPYPSSGVDVKDG